MENLQQILDEGTDATEKLHGLCVKAAKHYCKTGNFDASAKAWKLASIYANAMAEGRAINVGGVRPSAGDK